jgi:hypothetical protein
MLYNILKRVNEPMVHGLAHGPFVLPMLPCSPLQAWLVLANIMRIGTLVTPWSNNVIHQFWTDPNYNSFHAVSDHAKRGCEFLLSKQKADGGWGETYKVRIIFE